MVLNKNLNLKRLLLNELVTRFGQAELWSRRQMFAQICSYILNYGNHCLTTLDFCKELLPCLLTLGSDRVPNVRLMVAKTLYTQVANRRKYKFHYVLVSNTWIFMLCCICMFMKKMFGLAVLMGSQNPHFKILIETLSRLRRDEDRDVRYFADGNWGFGISAS